VSFGGLALKFNNVEVSGLIVLFIGVILLGFTFISAYGFLIGKLSILASADLVEVFGNAMAPLIEAVIHILYLGVMGWIGSILTIRAVQLLRQERVVVPPSQAPPQPSKMETKQTTPASTKAPAPAATPTVKTAPKQEAKAEERKDENAEAKEPQKPETQEKTSTTEPPKEPAPEAQAQ